MGIIHRDIKPENILLFKWDKNDKNCKNDRDQEQIENNNIAHQENILGQR